MQIEQQVLTCHHVLREVGKVISGKDMQIRKVMTAILAGGHILIEDIPGVGKTTMALAFARAMALSSKRMQFTPDVMPSDVIGFNMFQKESQKYVYVQGPVMTNLFLADEINRTSPKTQSALLQVMEEGKVSIDGHTRPVPDPFIVIATQNPLGSAGTQRLPDSQIDRFMISTSLGYPEPAQEIALIRSRSGTNPLDQVVPVMDAAGLVRLRQMTEQVFIHDAVYEYIVALVGATRKGGLIRQGISPRGTLALCRMSKACAFMNGRDYVLPEDVVSVFSDVAFHRLIMDTSAGASDADKGSVIRDILGMQRQPVPR